jgi:NAD(P)-dependent dehydrogenase (short-subunit alcohol dehydrogenase family)
MEDPLRFSGKGVFVTGSSRVIGADLVKAFGKRGAKCVANYVADAQTQDRIDPINVANELNDRPRLVEIE